MKNQSLQDQLLKAGLVSDAKAKQARTEKRKQNKKKQKNKDEAIDETKQLVQETKAKQAEQDRLLNEQRNQLVEQRQIESQIRMLIESKRLPKPKDEDAIAYHFNDRNKVKTVYISEDTRGKLINGKLAIVKLDQHYELVAAEVAEKIAERAPDFFIMMFPAKEAESIDDEYADYQVPDDLMW